MNNLNKKTLNFTALLKEDIIQLRKTVSLTNSTITLPASKSLSNRALIIDALSGKKSEIGNVSEARDTRTMQKLLNSNELEMNVKDAGTTMRFLTAYFAVTDQKKLMTGTPRMCERPIGILVEALQEIGAEIIYKNKKGYPPHETIRFVQKKNAVKIKGNVSSQYISALLMIAPCLPQGLSIELTGKVGSKPYIDMTLALMKRFGVTADWKGNVIHINHQEYTPNTYHVEPDWSAASYWYSLVSLADNASITLRGLTEAALQGDSKIVGIMSQLGVSTTFTNEGAVLKKEEHQGQFEYDFTHCPDLAQTVAVVCAAKGIRCEMTGLESLKIKETDRVMALQNELKKIGASLIEEGSKWQLVPSTGLPVGKSIEFKSYDDHRMAMAFAPLATKLDIVIEKPEVVDKSYPRFWEDLKSAGIVIL